MIAFGLPPALWGLLALPVLGLLYLLRRRSRPREISSLFLWETLVAPAAGGLRIERQRPSWLALAEALAILALVLAAAAPSLSRHFVPGTLAVVLDDSASMAAGGAASAREKAAAVLKDLVGSRRWLRVIWILAGKEPEVIDTEDGARLHLILRRWRCGQSTAALEPSLAAATRLAGPYARVLVLTDQAPPVELKFDGGRIQWRAFGRPHRNLGIVAARRISRPGGDLCRVSILSNEKIPRRASLRIKGAPLSPLILRLPAGGRIESSFTLPPETGEITLALPEDDLPSDNSLSLPPPRRTGLRVHLDAKLPGELEKALLRVLDAAGARQTERNPADLSIGTAEEPKASGSAWVLRVLCGAGARPWMGPFLLEAQHPLCEGLDLRGIIWAAEKGQSIKASPLIMAGNIPLLADSKDREGRHTLMMRLCAGKSTLLQTEEWPVLIANLLHWRRQELPGPLLNPVAVGDRVRVQLPYAENEARLRLPSGLEKKLRSHGSKIDFLLREAGVTRVETTHDSYRVSAGLLNPAESSLGEMASGHWGRWTGPAAGGESRRDISWLFAFSGLLILLLHLLALKRIRGGGRQ